MKIIGLAGPARSGKDTIADYLVEKYQFKKFSFSDKLYEEVAAAFDVDIDGLHAPGTKDQPWMFLADCLDRDFVRVAKAGNPDADVVSPRFVLQTWGTEYRRAQDPDYWVNHARHWLAKQMSSVFPDMYKVRVVNTSVRYPNEAQWIRDSGGVIWHVTRKSAPVVRDHSSERPVHRNEGDVLVRNRGTISDLHARVDEIMEGRYERERS